MSDDWLPALDPAPVPLGTSGLTVGPIAWGTWRLASPTGADDLGTVIARLEAAISAGLTLIDTADVYGAGEPIGFGGAEQLLGAAFAARPDLRAAVVLASKGGIRPGWPYNSSPAYVREAVAASCARLGVERIDVWQIHRRDVLAHPREVATVLADLVAEGRIGHVGVSNHSPAELDALQAFLPFPLIGTQPEFSPLALAPLSDGTLDQAMARGLAVLAWSPLAGGRLVQGEHPAARLLAQIGARHDVDAAAATLAWIMAHPARIIPIVGSTDPARIACATDACKVRWRRSEWYAVLAAGRGAPLP